MKDPEVMQKAQKEVDEVIGTGPITVDHLSKLPYITACLRETLRCTPTIPGTTIGPLPDTTEDPILIGGGKYLIKPDHRFFYILEKIHRDPKVYGEDADNFRPERMLDEHFYKLPKNAWKVGKLRKPPECAADSIFCLAVWKWLKSLHWPRLCLARNHASNCNVTPSI